MTVLEQIAWALRDFYLDTAQYRRHQSKKLIPCCQFLNIINFNRVRF